MCVNCGVEPVDRKGLAVNQLFDVDLHSKSGIIKLIECVHCQENVDKYIGNLILSCRRTIIIPNVVVVYNSRQVLVLI